MTDEARFLKKQFGGLSFDPTSLNQTQNEVSRHFIEFGSYFFLVKANPKKKILGPRFRPNGSKLGSRLVFLPFFQVWFISFPVNGVGR